MRQGERVVAATLVAALVAGTPAWAASPSDWARVRGLKADTQLAVLLDDRSITTGALVAADEDGLTLSVAARPHSIARAHVREVRRAHRSAGRKIAGFFLGGALGAVLGAILGAVIRTHTCHSCEDPAVGGVVDGFFLGALAGAVTGLAIASTGGLVYRAP
ncbi:MAG TPA: hypothetical protein VGQ33_02685 [Vicinamibacteria bacterium]|nr:hypothetical protein [Vicinamibacteria bacterium]